MKSYNTRGSEMKGEMIEAHNGLLDLCIIVLFIAFLLCSWCDSAWGMNFTVVLLHLICTFVVYKEKKYSCFFFFITFFIFLLGTVFFGLFDANLKYKFQTFEIEKHVLTCLAVSIIGVYTGSVLVPKRKIKFGNHHRL